jgi:hypothetical protein
MACFLVPMGLGIITTLFARAFPKRWNINWLNAILWGAVLMLMVEHVAHGEITPYPPFLTAGILEIMPEMLSVGGPMAAFSTALWASIVVVNDIMSRKGGLAGAGINRNLGRY